MALVVEHRDLSRSPRFRAKPDAVANLRGIAAALRDMPRECVLDRAELLLWLSRMARQVEAVAVTGVEPAPQPPRQPFLPRQRQDARSEVEAVFGRKGKSRRAEQTTTVPGRNGRRVRVEVRSTKQIPLPFLVPALET